MIFLYFGKANDAWASYQDFLEVDEFSSSAEAYSAENLLDAFCSADPGRIQANVKQGNCWRALDVQVGRLYWDATMPSAVLQVGPPCRFV